MSVRFYVDVHVPLAITEQLRMRGVDVLTAQTDNATRLDDPALLDRATELGRMLFSHDKDLLRKTAWQSFLLRLGLCASVACKHWPLRRRSGIDWESEQSRGLVWEGGIPSALSRRINSLVLPIPDEIPQVFI